MEPTLKKDIICRLNERVGRAKHQVTQSELASVLGLSQGLISKIARGDFERRSKAIDKICSYLDIDASSKKYTVSPGSSRTLISALERNWDGSERHALMIAGLLDHLSQIGLYRTSGSSQP